MFQSYAALALWSCRWGGPWLIRKKHWRAESNIVFKITGFLSLYVMPGAEIRRVVVRPLGASVRTVP